MYTLTVCPQPSGNTSVIINWLVALVVRYIHVHVRDYYFMKQSRRHLHVYISTHTCTYMCNVKDYDNSLLLLRFSTQTPLNDHSCHINTCVVLYCS